MAIDAAILDSLQPDGPITLRFYTWSRPTVSLGYFQKLASHQSHSASRDADVVRRTTGGGAIVHDHELTYSIAVPIADRSPRASLFLYERLHRSIASALSDFGVRAKPWGKTVHVPRSDEPFLCFQRRTADDLVVSGYKVVGSAQRRGNHGVLQHGSILMRTSTAAPELPGCFDLGSAPAIEGEALANLQTAIACQAGELLNIDFTIGTISLNEHKMACLEKLERFKSSVWHARC